MQSNQIIWSPGVPLENMIQQAVEAAMVFYKGNKTAAAQSLGIAIRTLDSRLDKYKKETTVHEQRIDDAKTRREQFLARQRAVPGAAQFDTAATPSVHTAEVERRRAANGAVSSERVQPKPVAQAAAK